MSTNGIKFEYTRALIRASRDWGKKDRSGNYMTVALAVYNYTNGDGGSAYASAARISRDTGVPVRTVERTLALLRDEGLVHLDERGGRNGDGTTRASEYSLRIPAKWSDAADAEQAQPATGEAQPATRAAQPATSDPQPATNVADHQTRYNRSLSSDPSTSDPADSADESYCQRCEDATCNVCQIHWHERQHRYRKPQAGSRVTPCNPSSLPDTVEAKRCAVDECGGTPMSTGYCPPHHAQFSPLVTV